MAAEQVAIYRTMREARQYVGTNAVLVLPLKDSVQIITEAKLSGRIF
jgi:hypothetical protein